MNLFIGFLLASIIAYAAFRARSLSRSGAWAALLVGTVVFGLGGWQWAVLLLAFFVTSSSLSRVFKKNKQGLDEKFAKGGQRDAGQVFGNGGLATVFVGLSYYFPAESWPWLAFAAALAAVNADTWATELGVLNPNPPRMINNLNKVVEKGTSGGISLIGLLASLAGGGLIGFLAVAVSPQPVSVWMGLLIAVSGLLGSLFDSYLGATVQSMYYCSTCQKETEKYPLHSCNTPTHLIRGWRWLSNDWVNFFCSLLAVLFVILLINS